MRIVKALALVAVIVVFTVAAGAQVSAPQIPPPDEPAIYISSTFAADDGPVKVSRDVAIDVAGISIRGDSGRMRGDSQIVIENATITISPTVATHVRSRMTYLRDQLRPLPPAR
jgi:hypothetical protein